MQRPKKKKGLCFSISRLANNINLVLKCDSPTPLIYKVKHFARYKHPPEHSNVLPEKLGKIIRNLEKIDDENQNLAENEWICTDEVKEYTIIVASFDIPEFIAKSDYSISGIVEYQFKEKGCQLIIPEFHISVNDVINKTYVIKDFDIYHGEEEALLAALTVNEENELIVRVSRNIYTTLENIFEHECMFKNVNITSGMKKWFFKDGITDGSGILLFLEKETEVIYNLNVYISDRSNLQLLLHLLYQHIPNILILPKEYMQTILEIPIESEVPYDVGIEEHKLKEVLKKFGTSLESQINLVEKFCEKSMEEVYGEMVQDKDQIELNVPVPDYQKFRKELSDLEFISDLIYCNVEKYVTKSEFTAEGESQ